MVSVIIPTFNRINLISFTLKSLSPIRHPGIDMEIIVVDDGSDDGTWDYVLVNFPGITLLENEGKGAGAARNTGLKHAKGKYILYLDSDDLLGEHFFDQKITFLEKNKQYNACYGDFDFFSSVGSFEPSQVTFKNKYPLLFVEDNITQHLILYLSGKYIPPNAIVWRKDFLLKIKGHDESLVINQDVDIVFRGLFAGLKMGTVDDGTKSLIRNHNTDTRVGDPRNARQKWVQMLDIREKILEQLKAKGYTGKNFLKPLSYYIFSRWKVLRHTDPDIAAKYLEFAKKVYWPVSLRGNIFIRLAAKILGPVRVIQLKYFLLKRD